MALQVWLPLDGDLENQGLSDVTISGTPTFIDNGKIGKCLNTSSKIFIPSNKVSSIFNNGTMSIAFWYNNNGNNESIGTHAICGFQGNNEGDTDAIRVYDFFQYPTKNDLHYSMGTIGTGVLTGVFPDNVWVHVCFVYNNGVLTIYIDGVEKYNVSGRTSNFAFDKSYYIDFGRNQKLNDFRIYNHALSPKEVKEISKGLVLHYQLKGAGNENLVENSLDFSGWTADSGWTKETDSFGQTYYRFSRIGATANNWARLIPTLKVNPNNYQNGITVSLDLLTPNVDAINQKCIGSLQVYKSSGDRIGWVEPQWDLNKVKNNAWSRVSYTFTKTQLSTVNGGATSSKTDYTQFSFQLTQNGDIKIKNIKIEDGIIATPWCPAITDSIYKNLGYSNGIEYDTSGFKNNGTIISKCGVNLLKGSSFTFTSKPSDANWTEYTVNNISSSSFTANGWHYTATASNGEVNSSKMIYVKLSDLGLKYGDTITISYDIKGKFGSANNGLTVFHATSGSTNFWSYVKAQLNGSMFPTSIDNWSRISGTWKIDSDFNTTSGDIFYIAFGGGTGSEVDVYVKNVRIDFGSVAYNYETTIQNYLQSYINSPRYSSCYYFLKNSGIFTNINLTFDNFTFSFWQYHTVKGKMLIGSNKSTTEKNSNWYWYGDKSFKTPLGELYYSSYKGGAEAVGTWVHCVATYNGEKLKIYRNGIFEAEKDCTGKPLLEYLSIGNGYINDSYTTEGCVSDFRIYTTALSQEDILDLYHTSASIANNGTAFAYEFVE